VIDTARCLFVDERSDFFALLGEKLGAGFELVEASPDAFGDEQQLAGVDVVIVGLGLADAAECRERIEVLKQLAVNPLGVPVVAFLKGYERSLMRESVAAGAYDYFVETAPLDELAMILLRAARYHALRREVDQLRSKREDISRFGSMTTTDPNMATVLRFASKVASPDANVLITGETGTGKEVLARAIHGASPRGRNPFVAVACSSLPEPLIEAELFGHEKGAFTGAVAMRRGRFEAAERGTIFLDEIGELTPGLQVKLLRVLQERRFERLGSNQQLPMEARIICATHRNLETLTRSGQFRSDLYYRLNTIEIELPPLRERPDDIIMLAHLFLQRYSKQHDRPARRLAPLAVSLLQRYPWPGNIRELEHAIEHAVVICEGPEIGMEHLPSAIGRCRSKRDPEQISFEFEVRTFKRRLIEKGLERTGNNKVQAAKLLNISRSSLHRLIDELGIDHESADKAAS
jgi:DNA-binding NtrC family response regulator